MKLEPRPVKMKVSLGTWETHAPQPTIQSSLVNDPSESFIPSEERTWTDIPVNENFKGHTLEFSISNLSVKLVRHHDQEERETDGVGHSKSIGPRLRNAFQRTLSLIQLASSILQKGAKNRFQHCKIAHDVLLKIRAIPGHTGGNVIAPKRMGHVAIPSRW